MKVAVPLAYFSSTALVIDAGIRKKIHGSGTTTLMMT